MENVLSGQPNKEVGINVGIINHTKEKITGINSLLQVQKKLYGFVFSFIV